MKVASYYRPWRPLRENRGLALLYSLISALDGGAVNTTPRPPLPRERPGTYCTGGWVGLGAGLDRCGKSPPPPPGIDPRIFQPVSSRNTDWAIPTPLKYLYFCYLFAYFYLFIYGFVYFLTYFLWWKIIGRFWISVIKELSRSCFAVLGLL